MREVLPDGTAFEVVFCFDWTSCAKGFFRMIPPCMPGEVGRLLGGVLAALLARFADGEPGGVSLSRLRCCCGPVIASLTSASSTMTLCCCRINICKILAILCK